MSLVKHDTMAKHKTGPDNHGTADVSVWGAELLTDCVMQRGDMAKDSRYVERSSTASR